MHQTLSVQTIAAVMLIASLIGCSAPERPRVRAVPTDTLKVNPELLKDASGKPVTPAPAQSK